MRKNAVGLGLAFALLAVPAARAAAVQPQQAQTAQQAWEAQQVNLPAARRNVEEWRRGEEPTLRNDFGQLARYRAADAALPPARPGEPRVVFFGDSITDTWNLDDFFPGKDYINRGISGQTTSQMLLRFRQDVIDLDPDVVIILAGTNDIAGNTGPATPGQIESNYASMAELARMHGIEVVFSSVTPVSDYAASKDFFITRSPAEILALNQWIKGYCAAQGLVYLDYFDALVDKHGMMRRDLSADGLHPNEAGFKVMAPLAQAAIERALLRSERR